MHVKLGEQEKLNSDLYRECWYKTLVGIKSKKVQFYEYEI